MFFPSRIRRAGDARMPLSWLLCLLSFSLAMPAYSQSVDEAARRERERKQNLPRRATHVYDNDDLARPQILKPEDKERVQATKKKTVTPGAPPSASETVTAVVTPANDESKTPEPSLGDIARKYRAQRAAAQKSEPSPVETPQRELRAPVLAYPKFANAPLRVSSAQPKVPAAPALPIPKLVRPENVQPQRALRAVQPPVGRAVRVQPGDTLWKLAREHLGRGTSWLMLTAINPEIKDPWRLPVGMWVSLPEKNARAASVAKSVRVERGDTLWKLARIQFGHGEAWGCLARANPQLQDANLIVPGEILTVPANCTTSPPKREQLAASGRLR